MSNFTKSIVYSGVVLAAGLVAIFAIYNNMSGNDVASIEPAAGSQAGEGFAESFEGFADSIQEAAEDATEAASDMAEHAAEATEEAMEDAERRKIIYRNPNYLALDQAVQ